MRRLLTDASLRIARPPAGGRLEVADTLSPVLFRMTPNGARSWSVRVRTRDGRKLRATIGPYPTIGVHDARAHAQRIRADIGTAEKLAVFTQRASPRKRARPALHIAIDVIVRAEDHSGPAPMLASET